MLEDVDIIENFDEPVFPKKLDAVSLYEKVLWAQWILRYWVEYVVLHSLKNTSLPLWSYVVS